MADQYAVPLLDSSFEMTEGLDYQAERWDITDLLSSLYSGSGETLRVLGRGAGISTVEDFGKDILSSSFAQPDESTYKGEDTALHGFAKEVTSSIPLSGALLGATAAGGLPGLAAAGGVLTRGLYLDGEDRYWQQHPEDGNSTDARNYAAMHSAVEGVTEVAGAYAGYLGSTYLGKISKPFLTNAIERGVLSSSEVLGQVAEKIGAKGFISRMVGGAAPEGLEEVAGAYLQDKIDTSYDMKTEAPDYWKTFLIGAAASLPFTGIGAKITQDKQNKIRDNINKGLASDDLGQRQTTADQIFETINKVNPEAAAEWKGYVDLNVDKGPISITDTNLIGSAWKANIKKQEELGTLNQITKDPTSILKEAGIPTSSNVYGPGAQPFIEPIAPPPVTVTPEGIIPREVPAAAPSGTADYKRDIGNYAMTQGMAQVDPNSNQVVQQEPIAPPPVVVTPQGTIPRETPTASTPGTASYLQPQGPYSMAQGMAQVDPDSNNVIVQPEPARLTELKGKKKLNLKEKKELRDLQSKVPVITNFPKVESEALGDVKFSDGKDLAALAERAKASGVGPLVVGEPINAAESKTPKDVDPEDLIYTKQDLEGLMVKIKTLKGQTKSGKLVYKNEDVNAHKALSDIDEEIRLYEDIMRCASK